jgi:uncharacterized protein (DUF1800 family)
MAHNQAAGDPWAAYVPDEKAPWNLQRVVHLHRRAGFAATWGELQRDLKDGPRGSLDRLLAGKARLEGVPDEFEAAAARLADAAVAAPADRGRLKAWWMFRMLFGSDALTERLTLMWHNHFATSVEKVNSLDMMRRQNDAFRALGRARFGELLREVVKGPALLIWLDAPMNRPGHPNENLARELMELFTLGIGNYSEKDVKEGARALTGWGVVRPIQVQNVASRQPVAQHDEGEKELLGRKGNWTGDDFVRFLLEHPATAERLAWRLCDTFLGENAAGPEARHALADGLRERDLDLGWAVETILRSRAFFAEANLGTRVLGPVDYVVGSARALALFDTPPSTLLLADWAGRLGQDLFQPPNVGGWSGGRTWISPQTVIGRANFAAALVSGRLARAARPVAALSLAQRHGRAESFDDVLDFYGELLRGAPPKAAWRARLAGAFGPNPALDDETVRRAVALLLASPEMQLA